MPYLLSGLVYCGHCGDVLCGKSAHGNGGKIGYYEHGWAVRKESGLTKKVFDCGNYKRIGAKKLEPLVIEKIKELLNGDKLAQSLLEKVRSVQNKNPHQRELDRLTEKIAGLDRQQEALTERLSELPKELSAASIYKHMEKVEEEKRKVEELAQELNQKGAKVKQEITELEDFQKFLKGVSQFIENADEKQRTRAIRALVHRVDVFKDTVKIHFYIGKDHIKKGPTHLGGPAIFLSNLSSKKPFTKNSSKNGSNSLTIGGP